MCVLLRHCVLLRLTIPISFVSPLCSPHFFFLVGKVYNLTTIAMEPPIFEMENFLLPEECAHLQTMAGDSLYQSDSTYLDGSTKKTVRFAVLLQNAMTSSEGRTSAESRGLPHREVTDGLRRPPF